MQDLMKLVNKKAGRNVAHDLTGDNPTSVKEWLPTGSRWLDSIICKGSSSRHSGGEGHRDRRVWNRLVNPIWPHR